MFQVFVNTYDGQKPEEIPVSVIIQGRQMHVKVLSLWVEEDENTRKRKRGFHVEVIETGERFWLYHHIDTGQWFIKLR